jgi:TolB-like protein/DNA-binding winged helix-turn-helix (wHTH) protein/Flp pilus assembly protein TadD
VIAGATKLRYLFEHCSLDTERRELRCGAGLVPIEPQVFDLLEYLIRNRERVVSRDDLLAKIWLGRVVSDSALTTRINAARAAVGDSGDEQRLIKTLPRKGIRFVGEVREDRTHSEAGATMPAALAQPAGPPAPPDPLVHLENIVAASRFSMPDRPSIAVLPFTNISGDPEQDYFADGMAEEILTALSRCKSLFVIARNSSFTYKGKPVDVRQVGRELGVRYVLEGSVRRGANRLRFTAQLIDATSGAHIWADRFEGEVTDVFELQDRFTESIVAAIEPNLQLAEIERLKNKPVGNLDAYDLILRAQQLEYEFTEESLTAALACLKQALVIDPSYAPAMALAAYCYVGRRIQGWTKDFSAETAEGLRLASRAVELGKDDGNVLWMAAYSVWQLGRDVQRANELAYRSLRLNSNSTMALAITAWTEMIRGNPGKAIELYHRADRLSPRDPRGWLIATGLGLAHFYEGRFDEAKSWAEKALSHNPRFAIALRCLAASLAKLGQREEASAVVREMLRVEPQFTLSSFRAQLRLLDDSQGNRFLDALRLAGFPE